MTTDWVCLYCHDTGWTATIDGDGNIYAVTCPDGCPTVPGAVA